MKVFVLSFGTIEFLDGILVIDTDLSYKTFEKEYSEVLSQTDKSIKKLLKNAFEKGEFEIDSKNEKVLLSVLKQLEEYDKPTFDFAEEFEEAKEKRHRDKTIESEVPEPIEGEPEIFEEPDIFEQEDVINQADLKSESELGAADLQDALSSMETADDLEESETTEFPMEEEPISEIEAKSEGIESNFLVQLTETANFELDHNNKITSGAVTGGILLKNAGSQDRIWDINLKLEKIKSTSLKQNSIHINELSPDKTWNKEYKLKKPEKIPLNFKERIDTFLENSEEIHTLIPKQETIVEFDFSIENPTKSDISDFEMEKNIPNAFTDLKVIDDIPDETKLQFQDQLLTWNIPTLKPKQALNLKIQAKISPSDLNNIKTGSIQIKFSKLNDLYSDLILEDVLSISKNMYYIEKDEKEQSPNNWSCHFIFENKSEFPLLLESAEIFSGDITSQQKEVVFRTINEVIYPDDEEWRSPEWTVTDEEVPTFGKSVNFKIIPIMNKLLNVNISIAEIELPILWVTVQKDYSLTEIASYIETEFDVVSSVFNKGDAEINELIIEDYIPENFMPPALNDIHLLVDDEIINKEKNKVNLTIKKEPDSNNSTEPHKFNIQLSDLRDSIGAIKKGSKLDLQYSVKAIKPTPDKDYNFPITITVNTNPVGPSLEITPDMVESSELKVTHRRRRLTVGKSVFPGESNDEYEILMVFKNRGNAPIENAVITDLIPTNFKLLISEPEATVSKVEDKSLLEWKFDVIQPGKKLEFTYKIKGTGEYKTSDAEIFYKV